MIYKKPPTKRYSHLTESKKWEIVVDWYSLIGETRKCPYRGRKKFLLVHHISHATLQRVLQQYETSKQYGGDISMKPKSYGMKSNNSLKHDSVIAKSATKIQIKEGNRFVSSRKLAALVQKDTNIPVNHKSMLKLRRAHFDTHCRVIEPKFTEHHRFQRIRWVCNEVDMTCRKFHSFLNTVHIDEAWIVQDSDGQLFWWPNGVPLPEGPKHHSKRHVKKVMVLVALAQPRSEYGFNGLVGIYSFTKIHTYLRNSKHHRKGETKLVTRPVDADAFREIVLTRLVPDMKRKMYWCKDSDLFCQIDSATPHLGRAKVGSHKGVPNLDIINASVKSGGWRMQFVRQPPQTPFMNINDLGFFHSFQTRLLQVYIYI